MSTAKNAQCSQIARNVEKGKYVKQYKFANFGSVAEDTLQGQQRLADERLKQIQTQRKIREGARWIAKTTRVIATQ